MPCCCQGDGAEAPPPDRRGGGGVSVGPEAGFQRRHEESALLHPAAGDSQRSEVTRHTWLVFRLMFCSFIVKVSPVLHVSCPDVERYSDKYNRSEQMDKLLDWAPGEAPPTASDQSKISSIHCFFQDLSNQKPGEFLHMLSRRIRDKKFQV